MSERVVYLNGEIIAESKARVSIFDRGFTSGDGIYEATRTFKHKLFRLDAHIDRLYNSLRYVRLDCGISPDDMSQLCTDIIDRNLHLIGEDDDYSLWHVITRGPRLPGTHHVSGPTVCVFVQPVDFERYARFYLNGLSLVTPATRRTPPQCLDPGSKITNKMNHNIAAFEARLAAPDAIPLMLDLDGNIAETDTANFFFIRRGKLCTPTARTVLRGITREAIIEVAKSLNIEVVEGAFTPFDVFSGDEAFISGTSGSITPVRQLNGVAIGTSLPGPVTLKLIKAWNEMIGLDYVSQALRHLGDNTGKDLLAQWEAKLGEAA